tara:strand:+ start:345 stop:464 length:120 start_codon:yes stop_codon:yes gene_type:complete
MTPKDIDKKTWNKMVEYTKVFLYLIGSLLLGFIIINFLL